MNQNLLKNKYFIYALSFIFSILVIVSGFLFQDKLIHFKTWGLFGIFLFNFFSTATIFVPSFSLATVVAGGSLYNPILVAFVATLGGVLGDSISFILGQSGRHILLKEEGRIFIFESNIFKKNGMIVIFIFAMIPNPIFDALGILAGSLDYSFKRYLIAMAAGRIVRNIIFAYVGKYI